MRDIYRMYQEYPEMLEQTVKVGWIQNLAIMEADLNMDARHWYLLAAQRFGWSKAELTKQIAAEAHLKSTVGEEAQDQENADALRNRYVIKDNISRTIAHAVDFLDGLWYNVFGEIYFFRQTGIAGEPYG